VAGFTVTAGGVFTNQLAVHLAGVPVANNRAAAVLRLVSDFAAAGQYQGVGGGYGTAGTWRFDQVTVTAVPAPFAMAGMNPTISTPDQGATAAVSWTTSPGFEYRVESSTNLTTWAAETGWLAATGSSLGHTSPVPGLRKFFRISSR
jgi:hypothetical protein